MSAALGLTFKIKKAGNVLAQCQSKSVKINNEVIEVTNDDSNGFRTLAAKFGIRSLDISLDGIADSSMTIRNLAMEETPAGPEAIVLTDITIEGFGWTISGSFMLTSYEESGSFDDAIKFSAELQSTGQWTYATV